LISVDLFTCREILRIRESFEPNAPFAGGDEYYWFELLKACDEATALTAAWEHYRKNSGPLTPAVILRYVGASAALNIETESIRGRLLMDRALSGLPCEALARWNGVFVEESGSGATYDSAALAADRAVEGWGESIDSEYR
jgi:hypothetical protein